MRIKVRMDDGDESDYKYVNEDLNIEVDNERFERM